MQPIIAFSHLRWDFVYQRPQHLISRLARQHPVWFIEEPVQSAGPPSWHCERRGDGLVVCQPHTPRAERGFHDQQMSVLGELVQDLVQQESIGNPIAWLYTPLALPLASALHPALLVYDCMDELSLFRGAPRQLVLRERALLKAADLVFTGGRSLYRAKRGLAANVHCFPSSVEREHFGQARSRELDHPDQAGLDRPRLGFYGVIDERLDTGLLGAIADAHPEWNLVMVGPVVKIESTALPLRPNIHWFGQRGYAELPRFLAGWDLCLLPFALNDATRYISPTKTLEYMAAEKPIVSTPITDVVEPYGDVVGIGATPAEFIERCEQALGCGPAQREAQARRLRAIIDQTSWDATAAQMESLLAAGLQRRRSGHRALPGAGAPARRAAVQRASIIVLGAGPTGLSAAYHAGEDALLLEQHDRVGGWCRSIVDGGFTFDYAGHIMFSNDPYVHELYRLLLGDNVHWQDREAWIWSKGVYTRYPFQGALHGLPPEVACECIVGAIEARFGPLKTNAQGRPITGSSPSACKAESITDCCADGTVESVPAARPKGAGLGPAAPARAAAAPAYANFEEFIYRVWGRGIARHFAVPYNRKLWAVPLEQMETSWLGGRVPMPDLEEMIEGALRPVAKPQGPNARFGYPLRGGFQALMDGFLPLMRGRVKLNANVVAIDAEAHRVTLGDGTQYAYEQLISTMPLPALIAMLGSSAPQSVQQAAHGLRHVSVRCVNLGVGRERLTEKHWIYYPEDSVFHRIFVQGNASPWANPPGGFGLTCEITYSPSKPLPCDGEALIDRCIRDCIAVGLIDASDPILVRNQIDMPHAYVVYDHERAANVAEIRPWLEGHDILLAGRYSEWEYYNSDHAFIAGRRAAEAALGALRPRGSGTGRSGSLAAGAETQHAP